MLELVRCTKARGDLVQCFIGQRLADCDACEPEDFSVRRQGVAVDLNVSDALWLLGPSEQRHDQDD